MIKNWKKTNEGIYAFFADSAEIGKMELLNNSSESKAVCFIKNNQFTIKRTGFWKSTIEISNKAGQTIIKVQPEKWYATYWTIDYNNKKYKLTVRNNPLSEWAILDNSKEIAAYGLFMDNDRLAVKITNSNESSDFLFDFLLWYLFAPIATENMDDSFTFLMLTVN